MFYLGSKFIYETTTVYNKSQFRNVFTITYRAIDLDAFVHRIPFAENLEHISPSAQIWSISPSLEQQRAEIMNAKLQAYHE